MRRTCQHQQQGVLTMTTIKTTTYTRSKRPKIGDLVTIDSDHWVVLRQTLVPAGTSGKIVEFEENGDLIVQLNGDFPELVHRRNTVIVPPPSGR
jgi:hypothetical protein